MVAAPRSLINDDGGSFDPDLDTIGRLLAQLGNEARKGYRNTNASNIATHGAVRLLIVAGPGSGKSTLFCFRIKHWLPLHVGVSVYVLTFVRKLVQDLQADIESDESIPESDRDRIDVSTLHRLARSLVERNTGTANMPLAPHVQVIAGDRWQTMVWRDVLEFYGDLDGRSYTGRQLERQFHTEEYESSPEWGQLRDTYAVLRQFYNAVGFADMIVLAREAVEENDDLSKHRLWIVDEFQDLNAAECHLIEVVTSTALGVLIAGDDDQAIYQELKESRPEIIGSYYQASKFANAMLPFCSRCDYFICMGASAFIEARRHPDAIRKIYLPLQVDDSHTKIQQVVTATPTGAVDYIEKFLEDHGEELERHIAKMKAGQETDPFLLILTPDKKLKFYRGRGDADQKLRTLLKRWVPIDGGHSEDYRMVATYYTVGLSPTDNFPLRKVLDYEGASTDQAHAYIVEAITNGVTLAEVLAQQDPSYLEKAKRIASILSADGTSCAEKVSSLSEEISVLDPARLAAELDADPLIDAADVAEDEAEEAIQTAGAMAPVELMTMFKSKGLSAQHVIIIGCDDANLKRTVPLTFFVGITRARHSLHLITALRSGGAKDVHEYLLDLPGNTCDYVAYKKGPPREFTTLAGIDAFRAKVKQLAAVSAWKAAPTKGVSAKKAAKRRNR